jgi:opacity protein-like surface antigen
MLPIRGSGEIFVVAWGLLMQTLEDRRMKTAIIALSVAALMSAAAAVAAQDASSRPPGAQHHVAKKHRVGVTHDARRHAMQAKGFRYPGAFGYAPAAPSVSDQDFVRSRQFGGGGGGGGGGGSM